MVILKTIQEALNDLASTTGLTAQEAANVFADTTGLSVQDALAVVNGKGKLLRQESANDLALESGLTLQEALNTLLAQSTFTTKGGVTRYIDDAVGDIARTTSGSIEDPIYNVSFILGAGTGSAMFDSTVTRTGRLSVKLSNTNTSGATRVNFCGPNSFSAISVSPSVLAQKGILVKPSTTYRLTGWIKTNNVVTNSVRFAVTQYNSSGTTVANTTSTPVNGTQDWTQVVYDFTSNASTNWLVITGTNNLPGNISDAWFDLNGLTLEEVTTINNTSGSPAYLYPKGIAVTSTDNIDQSQVASTSNAPMGSADRVYRAQQFTPSKKNNSGCVIRKGTGLGTYIGDMVFTLRTDNSDDPSSTILETVTIPNATWEAITVNTDYTIPFTTTLTAGTPYWLTFFSTTTDASNYTALRQDSSNLYPGLYKYSVDGTSWTTIGPSDLYFKTLYSKNTTNFTVRTDTQEVSVTAPTPDGWEDGTVVNIPGSLELAPGSNNLYLSSNGANEASGDTDSSLQGIIRVTKRLS
jgi:hypothetical protein